MSSSEQAFWLKHLGAADRFTAWVASEIGPFLGRTVLEIGCGTGTFTRLFAASAERVLALDLDARFVEAARNATAALANVRVERADAAAAALPQGFDTVVMLDVLEHIADDTGMLRRARAALNPGGRIILKVPAIPALYSPMDEAIGHYRRYSRPSLRRTLTEAGFEPFLCRHFNALGVAGWWLNGTVLKRRTPPAEQVALFDRLVPFLRGAERVLGPPFGLSLIAVGTRKNGPDA